MGLRDEISGDSQNMFTIGLLLVHFVQCTMLKTTESDQISSNFEVESEIFPKKITPLTTSDAQTPNVKIIDIDEETEKFNYRLFLASMKESILLKS
jgi:hypothetical protein